MQKRPFTNINIRFHSHSQSLTYRWILICSVSSLLRALFESLTLNFQRFKGLDEKRRQRISRNARTNEQTTGEIWFWRQKWVWKLKRDIEDTSADVFSEAIYLNHFPQIKRIAWTNDSVTRKSMQLDEF